MNFAEGGTVKAKPGGTLALIGENGPELVVPLRRHRRDPLIPALMLVAVFLEITDLLSYTPANEHNPLVLFLGGWAPLAKLLLITYLVAMAYVLPRLYARRVLLFAAGMGLLGLASNIA